MDEPATGPAPITRPLALVPAPRSEMSSEPPRGARHRRAGRADDAIVEVLSLRPWLRLDVIDIVLATELERDVVVTTLSGLVGQERVAMRRHHGRYCYSLA